MPIAWTTSDGGKLENGNMYRNKASTGAGHKSVLGSLSEVATPGDTGPAQSRREQIHRNASEGHGLVPTVG